MLRQGDEKSSGEITIPSAGRPPGNIRLPVGLTLPIVATTAGSMGVQLIWVSLLTQDCAVQ